MDGTRLTIIYPDGTKKGVGAWKEGIIPAKLDKGETRRWMIDLKTVSADVEFVQKGTYTVYFTVNRNESNRVLVFVDGPSVSPASGPASPPASVKKATPPPTAGKTPATGPTNVKTSPEALLDVLIKRPDTVKDVYLTTRASAVHLKDGGELWAESIALQKEMAKAAGKAGVPSFWD